MRHIVPSLRTPCHVTQSTFYTGFRFLQLGDPVLTERSVGFWVLSVFRGP